MKATRLTAIGALALIFHFSPLSAAPNLTFPDGPAYHWSSSYLSILGAYSIDEGERLMIIFSCYRASDGAPHTYMQIIDNNGNAVYDPAMQLTAEAAQSKPSNAMQDEDGNIFAAWATRSPAQQDICLLYAMKWDNRGEPVWGGEPRVIGSIPIGSDLNQSPGVLSDYHGGFYFVTNMRFLAIDENGSFRLDWPWRGVRPNSNYSMMYYIGGTPPWEIKDDGVGGIWWEMYDRNDPDTRLMWNHLDYNGELLWELPRGFNADWIQEVIYGANFLQGNNGGAVFYASVQRQQVLFLVDENGVIPGQEYFNEVGVQVYRTIKLQDGTVVGAWAGSENGLHTTGLIAYNPESNSFPWGEEGLVLGRDPVGERSGVYGMGEMINGEVMVARDQLGQALLFRIASDGELVWNEPQQLDQNHPYWIVSKSDNGCWALGYSWFGYGTEVIPLLRSYDEEGWPTDESYIDCGFDTRTSPLALDIRLDDAGRYRSTFYQMSIGLTEQILGADGEIIGEPTGRVVVPSSIFNFNYDSYHSTFCGDRTVFSFWGCDLYDTSRYFFWRSAVSLNGEELWTATTSDSLWFPRLQSENWGLPIVNASPDGTHLLMTRERKYRRPEEPRREHRLICFSAATGDIEWQITPDQYPFDAGSNTSYVNVIPMDSIVYQVYTPPTLPLVIAAFNYQGQTLFIDSLSRPLNGVIDPVYSVTAANDNDLWIVTGAAADQNLDPVISFFDGDTRRLSRSFHIYTVPFNGIRPVVEQFGVVPSGENLWILPFIQRGQGVQGLTPDGEPLLGDIGLTPPTADTCHTPRSLMGFSDGNNGLWLIWREASIRMLHIDGEGRVYPGYDPEGLILWEETYQAYLNGGFPQSDGSIILSGYTQSTNDPMGWFASSGGYTIQRIWEDPIVGVQRESINPDLTFQISRISPNPFNSTTTIRYTLPVAGEASLRIFDLSGREVATLVEKGAQQAGPYAVRWDAGNIAAGVYVVRLETGNQTLNRKIILLH